MMNPTNPPMHDPRRIGSISFLIIVFILLLATSVFMYMQSREKKVELVQVPTGITEAQKLEELSKVYVSPDAQLPEDVKLKQLQSVKVSPDATTLTPEEKLRELEQLEKRGR